MLYQHLNDAPVVEAPLGGMKFGLWAWNSKAAIDHYSAENRLTLRMGDMEGPFLKAQGKLLEVLLGILCFLKSPRHCWMQVRRIKDKRARRPAGLRPPLTRPKTYGRKR